MNWLGLLVKLPAVIEGTVRIVDRVKDARGADKKAAVLESIPESIALAEFTAERDLLNDPAIAELISALVDAEVAVARARNALKAGLLAKRPA